MSDLNETIRGLVDTEILIAEREIRRSIIEQRQAVLVRTRELWEKAEQKPRLNTTTGNVAYVSRSEAMKYGRFEKLTEEMHGIRRVGALSDISTIERAGVKVYEAEFYGNAWVYREGYGLPITGGVQVRLIAQALYSDHSGGKFNDRLRINWSTWEQEILQSVTRGLNQGLSYSAMAEEITKITDRQYWRSLRVARTEASRIQSQAHLDADDLVNELGIENRKRWIATIDDRTRDNHADMDGEYADKNGIFHLPGGASGPAPGLTGVASEDINCRCNYILEFPDIEPPEERRIRGEGIVPFRTFFEGQEHATLTEVRANKE